MKKAIKIGSYAGIIIIILYGIVFFIPQFFFKEEMDKPWIEEFEEIKNEDVVKAIIYCNQRKRIGPNYKVIITDKDIINILKSASSFDYGTKFYSGGYDQKYTIQLETKAGKKYMYGFSKTFTAPGEYCRKNIEYNGKLYPNPYNDCGQMSIYLNPYITENDLINEPYPRAVVSGYNLKLIGFIEKYAEKIPFDGVRKLPYYDKYGLEELKTMNKN